MFKLDLEKAEEPEIKLPTSLGSSKKQGSSSKTSTSVFIDYAKAFDCVDHNKLWKILHCIFMAQMCKFGGFPYITCRFLACDVQSSLLGHSSPLTCVLVKRTVSELFSYLQFSWFHTQL